MFGICQEGNAWYSPALKTMKTNTITFPTLGLLATLLLTSGCGRDPLSTSIKAIGNGDLKGAETILIQILKQDPSDASAMMNLAIIHLENGRTDDALAGFSKVADLAPEDSRPLEYMAAILLDNNQWREAGMVLNDADRRNPNAPAIQAALALVDINTTSAASARTRLLQVLARNPAYPPALFNLAVIERDWLKNPAEGRKYFQRYLVVAPTDSHAVIARSAMAAKTAVPPAGAPQPVTSRTTPAHITRSIPAPATTEPATSAPPLPRNPAEALEACRLATQFHQAGNYEKALQEYTRAIRNDPGLTRAHFNLGLLYRTRQDLQAARTSFETVLKLSPAMTDARYMLALVMTEQGKDDEAVKQLTTIIGKNPDHADAHLALGLLYKKDKSKVSLARKELSIYLKLQPDSLKSKDIRNWLKYQ